MSILNYLRKMLQKKDAKPSIQYVQDEPVVSSVVDPEPSLTARASNTMAPEIDWSHQADLEGYARGLTVSKESIERWISSGLLMPEELKVAEKLVKIMRNH